MTVCRYQPPPGVMQADTVMRKEIKTVTKCFEDALTSLGGLAEVDEINTEAALKAMDGCINRSVLVVKKPFLPFVTFSCLS